MKDRQSPDAIFFYLPPHPSAKSIEIVIKNLPSHPLRRLTVESWVMIPELLIQKMERQQMIITQYARS
jgi:hypothetical protein